MSPLRILVFAPVFVILPLAFVSCQDTEVKRSPLTVSRLAEIEQEAPLTGVSMRIHAAFERRGKREVLPAFTTKLGKEGRVEVIREHLFPSAWLAPRTVASSVAALDGTKPFPATPAVPDVFERKEIGTILTLKTQARGPLAAVSGELLLRELSGSGEAAGEVFGPIVADGGALISENKAVLPHFTERRYPVFALLKAGEEGVIDYGDLRLTLRLERIQ